VFTAEFIASDPEPSGVLQHSVFPCKVLCYQVLEKYGPFNPSPLLPLVRRLYVVKRRGNIYVLVELHGFFSVLLGRRKGRLRVFLRQFLARVELLSAVWGLFEISLGK